MKYTLVQFLIVKMKKHIKNSQLEFMNEFIVPSIQNYLN